MSINLFRDNTNTIVVADLREVVFVDGTVSDGELVSDATVTGILTGCGGDDTINLTFTPYQGGDYLAELAHDQAYASERYNLAITATVADVVNEWNVVTLVMDRSL